MSQIQNILSSTINVLLDYLEYPISSLLKLSVDSKLSSPRSILLFNLGGFGDLVMQSSFTKYLKIKFPKSKITLLTKKSNYNFNDYDINIDKVEIISSKPFKSLVLLLNIHNKYKYDLFVSTHQYPNLRFLVPFVRTHLFPYFMYGINLNTKLPLPNIQIPSDKRHPNSIVINFDTKTSNLDRYLPSSEQRDKIVTYLAEKYPDINFIVNKFKYEFSPEYPNIIYFEGGFDSLLKISSSSKGVISIRSGLCDAIAAGTKLPMFVIYPEVNYPGRFGSPFSKLYTLSDIGFENYIDEYVFNNSKNISGLVRKIDLFITKLNGQ